MVVLGIFPGRILWAANVAKTANPAVQSPQGDETVKRKKVEKLEVGDRLLIKIFPEDQFIKGGDMEVSSEGDITLPLIGKVKAEGKQATQVEKEVQDMLAKDYLVNPVVVIEVTRIVKRESRSVSILGQIQKPGTYEINPDSKLTLLQLISMAGGFTDVANVKKIKIIRKQGDKIQVIRANAEAIISGSEPDIELMEQDVIHVGESFF